MNLSESQGDSVSTSAQNSDMNNPRLDRNARIEKLTGTIERHKKALATAQYKCDYKAYRAEVMRIKKQITAFTNAVNKVSNELDQLNKVYEDKTRQESAGKAKLNQLKTELTLTLNAFKTKYPQHIPR